MKQIIINFPMNAPEITVCTQKNVFGVPHGMRIVPSEVSDDLVVIDIDSLGDVQFHKLTPTEFSDQMKELAAKYSDDEELAHEYMDDLMCKVLRAQGFGVGVDVFENQPKWYS